jgi:hypothetical protein
LEAFFEEARPGIIEAFDVGQELPQVLYFIERRLQISWYIPYPSAKMTALASHGLAVAQLSALR